MDQFDTDNRRFTFGESRFVFDTVEKPSAPLREMSSESMTDEELQAQIEERAKAEKDVIADLTQDRESERYKSFEAAFKSIENILFNDFGFSYGSVPKDANFVGNPLLFAKVVEYINGNLSDDKKNEIEDDADAVVNIIERRDYSPEEENSYQVYDVFVCMGAYNVLSEAEAKFKTDYPKMTEVSEFAGENIGFSVKKSAKGFDIEFEVSEGLKAAHDKVVEETSEEGDTTDNIEYEDQIRQKTDALRQSKLGRLLGYFLSKEDTYTLNGEQKSMSGFEAVARGIHPWGFIISFIAGASKVEGFKADWSALADSASVIPGVAGVKIGQSLEEFGKRVEQWASGETSKNLNFEEFVAAAGNDMKFEVQEEEGVVLAEDVKMDSLKAKKLDFVQVEITGEQKVTFAGVGVGQKDVFKIGTDGTETAFGTDGLVTELADAGTYKLKTDLAKDTKFSKGAKISIAKLPESPASVA